WRRLAHLGASRGPRWWVRYSPPFFGLAAAALLPNARRAVASNLRRIRGDKGRVRDALDVAHPFTTYAGCLAESLANGPNNAAAHLRKGGFVAIQLDRTPPGMRARAVTLFGAPGSIPEGPLRLAAAARVPIVPMFCARLGFRQYVIQLSEPFFVTSRASADLDL